MVWGGHMRLIHDGRTGGTHARLGAPYVALALLACVPGASRAQEQTQGSEASAGPLQEVIVTATRRAESLSKVPISVTALTQESLDERGIKDFSEVARFTTTQPSLTKTSIYGRSEFSSTQYGDPSYEAGAAIGGPLVQGAFGARFAVSYRHDGGWIDRIDPVTLQTVQKKANYNDTWLLRLAGAWVPNEKWTITPGIYYQNQQKNDIANYWPLYSDPSSGRFVNADPSRRGTPDKFYLTSLRIQGDLGPAH